MVLEIIILHEASQPENDMSYGISYMWNECKKLILMNLFMKQR